MLSGGVYLNGLRAHATKRYRPIQLATIFDERNDGAIEAYDGTDDLWVLFSPRVYYMRLMHTGEQINLPQSLAIGKIEAHAVGGANAIQKPAT